MANPAKQANLHPVPKNGAGRASRLMELAKQQQAKVSWADVDNQILRDSVVAVTGEGAAIMFGQTSDGGALSLLVLDGSEKIKQYPNSVESAESVLRWITQMYSND